MLRMTVVAADDGETVRAHGSMSGVWSVGDLDTGVELALTS